MAKAKPQVVVPGSFVPAAAAPAAAAFERTGRAPPAPSALPVGRRIDVRKDGRRIARASLFLSEETKTWLDIYAAKCGHSASAIAEAALVAYRDGRDV